MNRALSEFSAAVNPEGKKQILLILEFAVEVPEGIELFYLPPYSPPACWPLLKEVIANRVFTRRLS